jgi:hypothetical protein
MSGEQLVLSVTILDARGVAAPAPRAGGGGGRADAGCCCGDAAGGCGVAGG